jgi:C-terminal processing protease CtpA/Prc
MALAAAGAVLLLAATPGGALAGGSGKKCTYGTQECLNHMAERMKASGWIGIEYDMDAKTGLSSVIRVIPGSPAEKAGLQVDDVLLALGGIEINEKNHAALEKARKEWKPGRTVTYTVKRDGSTLQVPIVLGEWPADLLARYIGEHMLEHAEADTAAAHPAPPK